VSECTSCPGRSTFNSGTCYGGNPQTAGGLEIHGDPHFRGWLDQDYTITGAPGVVYNIITDPWVQYNTRFIWYGDVYHGYDPVAQKPYDANVTYVGEVGFKFHWEDNSEDRVRLEVGDHIVDLNGAHIIQDKPPRTFGPNGECSIAQTKKYVDLVTPRFRARFFRAGSATKPYFNQRVEITDWPNIHAHGLLGQTWKHEQRQGIDRNAIWWGHQAGVDFIFQTADFLEGRLIDYAISEDNVFGDSFTFNLYHKA